ncbi:spindle assembly abnormal protein 6 homolog [Poecilia reticulata]|uniref:spindle assembly abnormal protein 6 homolog n=1 Tax=Poecilia reticulata TaxID=8081 RepID=UPI0007E9BE37|nr:PREDICTED: spindle assembly abnormal protein 6 homolog [Poecilia reticulata]
MSEEVTFLKSSRNSLQAELDKVKCSYEELEQKFERDVSALKAEVETSEQELQREREASSYTAKRCHFVLSELASLEQEQELKYKAASKELQTQQQNFYKVTNDLKCDNSSLQQQLEMLRMQMIQERKAHMEEMVILNSMKATFQENTAKDMQILEEKERDAQTKLEKMKEIYKVLHCRYDTDIAALKQEIEEFNQVSCEKTSHLEGAYDYLEIDTSLTDMKEDVEQETPQESKTFQDMENESQPDHEEVLHQEVSSEEDPLEGSSSGFPRHLEPMMDFAAESNQEDLDNMDDGKMKKPKLTVWKRMLNFMHLKKSKKGRKD